MKILLSFFGVVVFISVVGFFMFKNRPTEFPPSKIMNPSYFENDADIGKVIPRRFFAELKKAEIIVLGSSPLIHNYDEVWRGFILSTLSDHLVIDHFYTVTGLRPLTKKDHSVGDLPSRHDFKGRVLIQVPSDELWLKRVEKAYPKSSLIFFQYPFSLNKESLSQKNLKCSGTKDSSFSCKAFKAGTRYYRKKLKENKLTAMMEQFGLNFFMVFIGEAFEPSN